MKIAFAVTFPNSGISGGRLHAWLAAAALAHCGHEVTCICNQAPKFLELLPSIPGAERIRYEKLKFDLLRGENAYVPDLWILTQERTMNGRFYQPIFENVRKNNVPSLCLLFESPNWPAATLETHLHGALDSLVEEIATLNCHFLCSGEESAQWAKKHWPTVRKNLFHVSNPPILASFFPEPEPRENDLLVSIVRRQTKHKGTELLNDLARPEFLGYRLVIIDPTPVDPAYDELIRSLNAIGGASFTVLQNLSEAEKYSLLKRARCLLFPSRFEGFGLPPAEALYWGTPTVACDLPILKEVHGDTIRYATPETFASTVAQELAGVPNYHPSEAARRIGDFGRWCSELDAIVTEVAMHSAPLPDQSPRASNDWAAIIIDQLENWNRCDTLSALGNPQNSTVSFEQDWLARWREHQLSSGSSSESIPFLTANPRHSLGSKLIQALEQTQAPFVLLIEDLLVLDQSKIAPAISALKAEPDAIGAAIPVRYHYQGPKPHHYLSEDGHLLAACGVFHRERLLEVLAKSRVTGCDLQPVIDLSYLTLSAGEKLVPTTGHAERLPPRNLGYDWEVLPSNKNTWHLESSRDPIGPIPCLDPCNLHERQSIASIRKTGLHLYGQASLGYLSSNLLASLLQNLQVHSPFWRLTFNPNSPHSTRAQLSHNYPLLSQFFLCRSVLTLILDAWLATVTQRELTFHNNPIKFENDCPTVS